MIYNEVRQTFLDFFEKNGHKKLPSGPLIPNDPTLLFTNAGMVQFKDIFLGLDKREYNSATTSQKCLRISGKHNDLEQVGFTKRHHTFFEMLGNFSFWRYFKESAIPFAWDLLVGEYGLDPEKLYITVFHTDEEAAQIWKKVSGKDVIKISTSDNFWSMGDTGPCGPCSEIFYDHGDKYHGEMPGDNVDTGDRYVEIWNIVFMQYNQTKDERVKLENPCIDTGMGLERIAAVIQGVSDNFETDIFKRLIGSACEVIKNPDTQSPSYRIIADHLRSSAFLISEGVLPSNEGRGYVLRRIIRRAVRHIDKLSSSDLPLLYKMVDPLIVEMGGCYPELSEKKAFITDVLLKEEERFKETLKVGVSLLDKELKKAGDISGDVAFKLYDTYGFPVDLTQNIAKEHDKDVDIAGFEELLGKQKESSKAAWKGSGDLSDSKCFYDLKKLANPTEFLGYASDRVVDAEIVSIVCGDSLVEEASSKDEKIGIILNKTPFYAESGGQVGDSGKIVTSGLEFEVFDTQKVLNEFYVHYGRIISGKCSLRDKVTAAIDEKKRKAIKANHTAVHVLHKVLRSKFGEQLFQKGSYVSGEKFHFDFNYPNPILPEEISDIEQRVDEVVSSCLEVKVDYISKDEAVSQGAIALFDEKYGDTVRVISVGDFSKELCGGTHVVNTAEIGLFKITKQSSVAAGVRRIEGVTSDGAARYLVNTYAVLSNIASFLNVSLEDAYDAVYALQIKNKKQEKVISQYKVEMAINGAREKKCTGFSLHYTQIDDMDVREARGILDSIANKHKGSVSLVLINDPKKHKTSVLISVAPELFDTLDARTFASKISQILSGKGGGGKAAFAQCGGEICTDIQKILNVFN